MGHQNWRCPPCFEYPQPRRLPTTVARDLVPKTGSLRTFLSYFGEGTHSEQDAQGFSLYANRYLGIGILLGY